MTDQIACTVTLAQELVRLRRALGEDALPAGGTVDEPGTLNPERIDIDVARLRSAADESGGAPEALAFYRFQGFTDTLLKPQVTSLILSGSISTVTMEFGTVR